MKVLNMNTFIAPGIISLMLALTVSGCDSAQESRVGKRSAGSATSDATAETKAVDGPEGPVVTSEEVITVADPTKTVTTVAPSSLSLSDVGMKSFNQINSTMASLTAIPKNTAAIVTEFDKVKAQLPGSNDAAAFSGANQGAITKLAVAYCDLAIESNTSRPLLVPGFNFAPATLAAGFTAPMKDSIIQSLTERFWGSELTTNPDLATAKATLVPLIDKMVTNGLNAQTAAIRTRNIVKGVCTAVLASSPVTLQ